MLLFFARATGGSFRSVKFAEDGYNSLVTAYDPAHSQVQEAAGTLIDCLIKLGDFYNAERYAEVTYSNLRDKKNGINHESDVVANGSHQLAYIIFQQEGGDLLRAEELVRESLRIRTKIFGRDHYYLSGGCDLLSCILSKKNEYGDETRELCERALAITIRNEGKDTVNTANRHLSISQYHAKLFGIKTSVESKQTHLLLTKASLEKALRIRLKILGPSHPDTVNAKFRLTITLNEILDLKDLSRN
jgi:hypothetical protein